MDKEAMKGEKEAGEASPLAEGKPLEKRKLPKGEKSLIVCLLLACVIALLSFLCFALPSLSGSYSALSPSVFDLAFGTRRDYGSGFVQFQQIGGVVFLFAWQVLVCLFALFCAVCCLFAAKGKSNWRLPALSSLFLLTMSLVASIVSFCYLGISDVDPKGTDGARIGIGPILYSILHICVIVLILLGIFLYMAFTPDARPSFLKVFSPSWESNKKVSKKGLDEEAKVDLIIKYKKMMDDGILTEEEFERKKEELLE